MILVVLHDAFILMVNRSPDTLLTSTFVVFNMRQVLQWLVLQGKLSGVLFVHDVRVAPETIDLATFRPVLAVVNPAPY